MYPQNNPNQSIRKVMAFIVTLLIIWAGFSIYQTIHTAQTTGRLIITTSNPKATLSISQFKSQAQIIGTGSANVRLPAGTYEVAAFSGSFNTFTSVTVTSKHTITKKIALSSTAVDPGITGLFSLLPIIGPSAQYQINYTSQLTANGTVFGVTITSGTDAGKAAALAWIRSQGYDPANYSITYQQQAITNYHYTEGGPTD